TRRLDIAISIGYRDDLERALAVMREVLGADERILPHPEAKVLVTALDGGFTATMSAWTRSADFDDLKSDLLRIARERLSEAGISTPSVLRGHATDPQPVRS
ncbi:MAG TPA: mechanosensitive ion channel family protein, partial [Rhodospirillales bacterium]|nr:mechanosensitive ion channel family protein [Rhodospirillales bacterium]